jgi:hypothetical protein
MVDGFGGREVVDNLILEGLLKDHEKFCCLVTILKLIQLLLIALLHLLLSITYPGIHKGSKILRESCIIGFPLINVKFLEVGWNHGSRLTTHWPKQINLPHHIHLDNAEGSLNLVGDLLQNVLLHLYQLRIHLLHVLPYHLLIINGKLSKYLLDLCHTAIKC